MYKMRARHVARDGADAHISQRARACLYDLVVTLHHRSEYVVAYQGSNTNRYVEIPDQARSAFHKFLTWPRGGWPIYHLQRLYFHVHLVAHHHVLSWHVQPNRQQQTPNQQIDQTMQRADHPKHLRENLWS